MSKKLSLIPIKLQKLDNIESRLNNLFTTVSSIDGKIAHLGHDVQVLQERKVRKTNKTVTELEESVQFNDEDIADL